jgi:hypothetical protein
LTRVSVRRRRKWSPLGGLRTNPRPALHRHFRVYVGDRRTPAPPLGFHGIESFVVRVQSFKLLFLGGTRVCGCVARCRYNALRAAVGLRRRAIYPLPRCLPLAGDRHTGAAQLGVPSCRRHHLFEIRRRAGFALGAEADVIPRGTPGAHVTCQPLSASVSIPCSRAHRPKSLVCRVRCSPFSNLAVLSPHVSRATGRRAVGGAHGELAP